MAEEIDRIDDLLSRIDLLQSYVEHLGDRINYLITLSRAEMGAGPPPLIPKPAPSNGSLAQKRMDAIRDSL